MKTRFLAITAVALALVVAGCTIHPPSNGEVSVVPKAPESRADKLAKNHFVVGDQVDSIPFARTVDGWGYVDSKALWVSNSPSSYYLLTLRFDCHDLRWAQGIGLKSRTSRLTRGDDILVRGQIPRSCKIDRIYEMTKEKPESDEQ